MTGLRKYIVLRIISLAFVVYCVLTIMFVIFKFLPGDPTAIFLDANFTDEMIDRQKALWGLDDPLMVQYVRYLKNMAIFDFGNSFFQLRPVRSIISEKLLNTCAMMLPSVILAVVLGTVLGSTAGWKRGSKFESATITTSLFLRSTPSFFVGVLVLMVFAYKLRWLPSGGMSSPGSAEGFWTTLFTLDFLKHLILPTLVLLSREITGPTLLMRSSMLEVKGSDFLDILKAKGLSEVRIIRHATRNALLPLITYIAVMTGFLFQGQVILEIIFSWPGIGREIVTTLNDLDYPVAQAIFFLMSLTILTMNFVADLLYGLIDPRVTYN
ncbi:MAG: ABC transporter permease [Deltaproteobacteria bacterium]|nr:ABC transporter permease [Deltaproteobacteria bacterium]MBL7175773.1 ABC transporter permease [Desulfobacteraceae bacterium]